MEEKCNAEIQKLRNHVINFIPNPKTVNAYDEKITR